MKGEKGIFAPVRRFINGIKIGIAERERDITAVDILSDRLDLQAYDKDVRLARTYDVLIGKTREAGRDAKIYEEAKNVVVRRMHSHERVEIS